jgi:hypothetical protein
MPYSLFICNVSISSHAMLMIDRLFSFPYPTLFPHQEQSNPIFLVLLVAYREGVGA